MAHINQHQMIISLTILSTIDCEWVGVVITVHF